MNRRPLLAVFAAIVALQCFFTSTALAFLNTTTVQPGEYKNSLAIDSAYTLYWRASPENNTIEFAITLKGTGWIGIGFNHEQNDGMNRADTFIAWFESGVLRLEDAWMTGLGNTPIFDTANSPAGRNNVLDKTGSQADGVSTVKFLRTLALRPDNDAFDKAITLGVATKISIGYHDADSNYRRQHCSTCYQKLSITFDADKDTPVNPPTPTPSGKDTFAFFPFHIVVTLGVAFLLIVAAVIITYVRIFHTNLMGHLLFHRKFLDPFAGILNNPVVGHFQMYSGFFDYLDVTLGEALMVFLYFALGATWFAHGYLDAKASSNGQLAARGFGVWNIFNLSVILLPITRWSFWTLTFGISFDRATKFHRLMGSFTWAIITVHFIVMAVDYSMTPLGVAYIVRWNYDDSQWNLAGLISWICFTLMAFLAAPIIRRKVFEVFLASHYIFGLLGILFAALHVKGTYLMSAMAISLFLLLVDYALRVVLACGASVKGLEVVGEEVTKLEISVPKRFRSRPGQYIFLWIPNVRLLEWHPFSIAASTTDSSSKTLTFFIKDMGPLSFTKRLHELAAKNGDISKLIARVEGPYGTLTVKPEDYKTVVIFAGGIGVTPMLSLLLNLTAQTPHKKLSKIYFCWSVREAELVAAVQPYLAQAMASNSVQLSVHLTSNSEAANTLKQDVQLSSVLKTGRVQYGEYLKQVRIENSNQGFAGVFVCGPAGLISNVQSECFKQSSSELRFQLHKETFIL